MKKRLTNILLGLIFFVGIGLLIYPTFSNWWNLRHQSRAIGVYTDTLGQLDRDEFDRMFQEALLYNEALPDKPGRWLFSEEDETEYRNLLNPGKNGMMGYVEIPSIHVRIPIYHGTDEATLQIAVGHLKGSSLPVGGANSHCVLSGHRGLPSAKLFTDLDRMKEGDVFYLHILDQTLAYETDQILVTEPEEVENLEIEEEKDLCTLVTCTPYGVNSQRLLIRGHRIAAPAVVEKPKPPMKEAVTEEIRKIPMDIWICAAAVAASVVFLVGCLIRYVKDRKRKRKRRERDS